MVFLILHSQKGQTPVQAGMVELVDIPDLGSGAERHGGSSPSTRTYFQSPPNRIGFEGFFDFRYWISECGFSKP
jgi:hypothetical protein